MVSTCRRTGLLIALAAVVLTGTGCNGDDDAAARPVEPGELRGVLPSAEGIGDGWSLASDPDGPTERNAPARRCPALAEVEARNGEAGDTVQRAYRHPDGRHIEITLDPSSPVYTDAEVDEIVLAVNDCDDAVVHHPDGGETTVSFAARPTDAYGDQGIRLSVTSVRTGADHDGVEIHTEGHAYRRSGIGVGVRTTDGIDADGERVPSDPVQLDSLAALLDASLEELLLD
jgi:hypothetical protein